MAYKYRSTGCAEPPPVYGHLDGGEPIVKPTRKWSVSVLKGGGFHT